MKKLLSLILLTVDFNFLYSDDETKPSYIFFFDGEKFCAVNKENNLAKCIELSPEQQKMSAKLLQDKQMISDKNIELLFQQQVYSSNFLLFLEDILTKLHQTTVMDSFDPSIHKPNKIGDLIPLNKNTDEPNARIKALEQFKQTYPEDANEIQEEIDYIRENLAEQKNNQQNSH